PLDVGLAVESPKGLVAPVITDLGSATLDDVVEACTALVESARNDTLRASQLSGGVISISNVGMFGATGLIPIVNPGQSSILGVGASQELFRPDDGGKPVLRHILSLALSCDHRVVDGAGAARFLQSIKTGLESPYKLLRRAGVRTIS
ncbi:MAG: 2-oxo acid dehydrogenase subunit E2, partial [Sphingobium sp.]|nr:2-oxo acid dehydrogenase subunit E2 [Sphingobium sp.]